MLFPQYADYHGPNRIPVAGTEYPRLLTNPLDVLGDLELRDIFAAFNRSDFVEARHLADKLALRLYEPREAQCLAQLAAGYEAWDRFDFPGAQQMLQQAHELLGRFAAQGDWAWAAPVQDALRRNLPALGALVAAQRNERPDYALVTGQLDAAKYSEAGRNKCEYEHGFLPKVPSDKEVRRYLDKACEMVGRAFGSQQSLEQTLGAYAFPKLTLQPVGCGQISTAK